MANSLDVLISQSSMYHLTAVGIGVLPPYKNDRLSVWLVSTVEVNHHLKSYLSTLQLGRPRSFCTNLPEISCNCCESGVVAGAGEQSEHLPQWGGVCEVRSEDRSVAPVLTAVWWQLGESIVGKARQTLERAIKFVNSMHKWKAKVVYGDTDSLFVHLPGRTREEAFRIGQQIADAVTSQNPRPVKLKFEKVS
ncbi:REV3L [Cordylochernes scorpioides]|uniref:DNA-directed DNA polymerase n=1 Tax=Cordylochernes scorpioides TaxID=51811 RepID=A0ABY6KR76_9ARAC|nr:REV3L [Cordylochernes scorpioides]